MARILVTTGNTDRYHMVDTLIRDLYSVTKIKQIKLDVIVGTMFEDKDELHKKYDNDPNVILHDNVKSMAEIMKTCDLAISANGTTVYELSAVGLPTISFAMVEEQVKSAKALSDQGVIDYCGHSYENPSECVKQIIKRTLPLLFRTHDATLLMLLEFFKILREQSATAKSGDSSETLIIISSFSNKSPFSPYSPNIALTTVNTL